MRDEFDESFLNKGIVNGLIFKKDVGKVIILKKQTVWAWFNKKFVTINDSMLFKNHALTI